MEKRGSQRGKDPCTGIGRKDGRKMTWGKGGRGGVGGDQEKRTSGASGDVRKGADWGGKKVKPDANKKGTRRNSEGQMPFHGGGGKKENRPG